MSDIRVSPSGVSNARTTGNKATQESANKFTSLLKIGHPQAEDFLHEDGSNYEREELYRREEKPSLHRLDLVPPMAEYNLNNLKTKTTPLPELPKSEQVPNQRVVSRADHNQVAETQATEPRNSMDALGRAAYENSGSEEANENNQNNQNAAERVNLKALAKEQLAEAQNDLEKPKQQSHQEIKTGMLKEIPNAAKLSEKSTEANAQSDVFINRADVLAKPEQPASAPLRGEALGSLLLGQKGFDMSGGDGFRRQRSGFAVENVNSLNALSGEGEGISGSRASELVGIKPQKKILSSMIDKIVKQSRWVVRNNHAEATFRIQQEQLGDVDMKVSQGDGQIKIKVLAASHAAARLLEQGIEEIVRQLALNDQQHEFNVEVGVRQDGSERDSSQWNMNSQPHAGAQLGREPEESLADTHYPNDTYLKWGNRGRGVYI